MSDSPQTKSAHRSARRSRIAWIAGGVALVVVIAAALFAEPLIERVVEAGIENMPGGYRGSIERVDLRPLSADVALVGMKIEKQGGDVAAPYLQIDEFVVGTVRDGWKLRTTLRIVSPVVNLVDAPTPKAAQWGPDFELAKMRDQLPFELSRVDIEDAEVHFRNFHADPAIDVYLVGASVTWEQLVGCLPPGSAICHSEVRAESSLMKSGRATLKGGFERAPKPQTELRLDVSGLHAKELNPLLIEYAKVDVRGGEVALDFRYQGRGDRHSMRIVPRISDLEVIGNPDDDTRALRKLGLAIGANWFERNAGTKAITIEGKSGGKFDYSIVDLPARSAKSAAN